ncbi:hypothetical protein M407DRAFT_81907 [Tulasnella calospora MUT 4182]|uniref:Protein kinase domain-containing protein n=1 Tax=Tulasnella calospora MUT 4182 TaxID=1051891 RepID=A0A0C3Q8M1_9AGAM|nr:hypothetical protein M407DRAFT_81907 [Tulasnella calospora MUT 4182]
MKIENENERERVLEVRKDHPAPLALRKTLSNSQLSLREAGFLVDLFHKNIIKLEGFVEDLSNNRIWLIFPWAGEGNLKDFAALRDWEIPERISLINDVTTGVEYLHSRNPPICHGDLKSLNILVNWGCRAVITDLGSARRVLTKAAVTQRNQNGKYTLRWAAPELLMDDEPGLWSDIWALGWICYEVMTNSIPFQDVKKDSVVVKHVIQGNLPSVSEHSRMLLIRTLHSLMMKCWSIDPKKRPTAEVCRTSIEQMVCNVDSGLFEHC